MLEYAEIECVGRNASGEHRAHPSPQSEQALATHHVHNPPPSHRLRAFAHALDVGLEGVDRVHHGVLGDARDRARYHVMQEIILPVPLLPILIEAKLIAHLRCRCRRHETVNTSSLRLPWRRRQVSHDTKCPARFVRHFWHNACVQYPYLFHSLATSQTARSPSVSPTRPHSQAVKQQARTRSVRCEFETSIIRVGNGATTMPCLWRSIPSMCLACQTIEALTAESICHLDTA